MSNFFIGILIGIGAIIPGISSGVFLVVFGLYEKIVDTVLHFFGNIKENFLYLFPIILGAIISIFLFSRMLLFVYDKYYIYTSYAFIGLILGSVPAIKNKANTSNYNFYHIMCFIMSFLFCIYLSLIEKGNISNISFLSNSYLIIAGFFMSGGIIIPGVSKTAILMILGIYQNYLLAISTLNFSFLIPLGIGLFIGLIFFMYLINFLFAHFKSYTYFLILGFVIGSLFVIYPGFVFNLEHLISIMFAIICFFIVKKIEVN